MQELEEYRENFGSPVLHESLHRVGLVKKHKRTERIFQEKMLLPRARTVETSTHVRIAQAVPSGPDEPWQWIVKVTPLWWTTHMYFEICWSVGSFKFGARSRHGPCREFELCASLKSYSSRNVAPVYQGR